MLRFASLVLFFSSTAEPNVPAQSEALFQSSVRVYGRKSLTDQGLQGLELEDASDLLTEAEGTEPVPEVMKPKEANVQGLALLYADLIWISGLLSGSASSISLDLCASLREFRGDFLAWLTALVSFGLTRSLLLPMLSSPKKMVETDDAEHEEEAEKVIETDPVPVQQQGMEIKLDVTNPVMIQRAREQLEEAERRAEAIKNAQPDHRDVFGCTSLHLAAHNGHLEDVSQLLERGFDANAQDNFGDTALHMAARSNSMAIVQELLQHGADPLRSNAFGKMPFAVAIERPVVQLLREAATKKKQPK